MNFSSLGSHFRAWSLLHAEGMLSSPDFVGAMLISFMAFRRPQKWVAGKMMLPPLCQSKFSHSSTLDQVPYLLDLIDACYVAKKLSLAVDTVGSVTISSIFYHLKFSSVKHNADNYINTSIYHWGLGTRPFVLLHSIPTPMDVLRMQADGTRVVTAFLEDEELARTHVAKLHYMDGMRLHAKDSFEFLIHDLKHMELFVDSRLYCEQVSTLVLLLWLCLDLHVPVILRSICTTHTDRVFSLHAVIKQWRSQVLFPSSLWI